MIMWQKWTEGEGKKLLVRLLDVWEDNKAPSNLFLKMSKIDKGNLERGMNAIC
jgi:hypothetical protein